MISIGKIIEKVLREKRIPITEFAQKINTNRNNVYNIFRRKTIDTGLLKKISEVLEFDFFQYCHAQEREIEHIAFEPKNLYTTNAEIKRLQKKIELLEKEIELLKAMLRDKETIIELMGKK